MRAFSSALAVVLATLVALPYAAAASAPAPLPAPPPAALDPGAFLFDALRDRNYRIAWDKLMKEVQPTPDWLAQFNRNFDGMTGEMKSVTIEGKPYLLSFVCKPENCGERKFAVVFDADGVHAYGALGGHSDSPAFYGAPPQELQDALAKSF
ncbi:MAG: hypothetical protein E7774_05770 [Bradyrhizobium sp.]|nr:MAG: hypothetical protein E7774_05770 [Bradyrhizobium sp.]